ncbi:hypothetical protein D3C84_601590 [compost metagenome]
MNRLVGVEAAGPRHVGCDGDEALVAGLGHHGFAHGAVNDLVEVSLILEQVRQAEDGEGGREGFHLAGTGLGHVQGTVLQQLQGFTGTAHLTTRVDAQLHLAVGGGADLLGHLGQRLVYHMVGVQVMGQLQRHSLHGMGREGCQGQGGGHQDGGGDGFHFHWSGTSSVCVYLLDLFPEESVLMSYIFVMHTVIGRTSMNIENHHKNGIPPQMGCDKPNAGHIFPIHKSKKVSYKPLIQPLHPLSRSFSPC